MATHSSPHRHRSRAPHTPRAPWASTARRRSRLPCHLTRSWPAKAPQWRSLGQRWGRVRGHQKRLGHPERSPITLPASPPQSHPFQRLSHLNTGPNSCLLPPSHSPVSLHYTTPRNSHLGHLPSVPTSVPMASTTKSADLPTWPVSKPGPQARTFCMPASGLTCTSKGLGKEAAGVNIPRCPHQRYPSSLCSEPQAACLPPPTL